MQRLMMTLILLAISILFEISKQINLEKEKDIDFASALSGLLVRLGGYLGILQNNPEDFLKQGVQLSDEEIDKKSKIEILPDLKKTLHSLLK